MSEDLTYSSKGFLKKDSVKQDSNCGFHKQDAVPLEECRLSSDDKSCETKNEDSSLTEEGDPDNEQKHEAPGKS